MKAFIILVILVCLATLSFAWNDLGGGICSCGTTCDDCENALGSGTCTEIRLTTDLAFSGRCIDDPANFNNKIFDCQGHSLTGDRTNKGLEIDGKDNNTIKDCVVLNCTVAISLRFADNSTLINNTVHDNVRDGIALYESTDNLGINNTAYNNLHEGFDLSYSDDNKFIGNIFTNNSNIGFALGESNGNVLINNTGYEHPGPSFWSSHSNYTVFINNTSYDNDYGFFLLSSSYNNLFINNTAYDNDEHGFYLRDSSNNNIFINNTAYNNWAGFHLDSSSNNTFTNNVAHESTSHGFYIIYDSNNNSFLNNAAHNSTTGYGFYLYSISNNTFTNNTVYNNNVGFDMAASSFYNNFTGNTAFNGTYGFNIHSSLGLFPEYNNFTGNTVFDTSVYGFSLERTHFNIFRNNTITNTTTYGIYLDNCNNNTFLYNEVSNNIIGFRIFGGSDNVLTDNEIFDNKNISSSGFASGILAMNFGALTINRGHLYDNDRDILLAVPGTVNLNNVIIDNPAGNFTDYTNISMTDVMEYVYMIKWTDRPPLVPGYNPISEGFIELSPYISGIIPPSPSPMPIDSLTLHWQENTSYNESAFRAIGQNWTWNTIPGTFNLSANNFTTTSFSVSNVTNTKVGILETYSLPQTLIGPGTPYDCTVAPIQITAPGNYLWNPAAGSMYGSGISDICINISASDVLLNCNNRQFDGTNISLYAGKGTEKVMVTNCQMPEQFVNDRVFVAENVTDLRVENNQIMDHISSNTKSLLHASDCENALIASNQMPGDTFMINSAFMWMGPLNSSHMYYAFDHTAIRLDNSDNATIALNMFTTPFNCGFNWQVLIGHTAPNVHLDIVGRVRAIGAILNQSDDAFIEQNYFDCALNLQFLHMNFPPFANEMNVNDSFFEVAPVVLYRSENPTLVNNMFNSPYSIQIGQNNGTIHMENTSLMMDTGNIQVGGQDPAGMDYIFIRDDRFIGNSCQFSIDSGNGTLNISNNYVAFSNQSNFGFTSVGDIYLMNNTMYYGQAVMSLASLNDTILRDNDIRSSIFALGSNTANGDADLRDNVLSNQISSVVQLAVNGDISWNDNRLYNLTSMSQATGDVTFADNYVLGGNYTALFSQNGDGQFTDNEVHNTTGMGFGLYGDLGGDANFSGNNVSGHPGIGIYSGSTGDSYLTDNYAYNNPGYGMEVFATNAYMDRNYIYGQDNYLQLSGNLDATDLWLGHDMTYGIHYNTLLVPGAAIIANPQSVLIRPGFVSMNSTNVAVDDLDAPANLTTMVGGCENLVFYDDTVHQFPQSAAEIMANGTTFIPAYSVCAGTAVTFQIDGFTGYATSGSPPDDKDEDKERLSVSLDSSCDGNVVTVTSKGDPVQGADVTVMNGGIISGTTDSNGEFSFEGCGYFVTVHANKKKYIPDSTSKDLVSCASCQLECGADNDCSDDEQCVDGECIDVACACGYVIGHQCIEYICCVDADCPQDQVCESHMCIAEFECESDEECLEGYVCEDDTCIPEEPECASDEDCPDGYLCENGSCMPEEVSECESDYDCAEGELCENGECVPEKAECESDTDCAFTEYCASTAECMPVLPEECGYAANHQWNNYECGDEPGCPDCPQGSICMARSCEEANVDCPSVSYLDEEGQCTVAVGPDVCADCDYRVVDPAGEWFTGRTDENGSIVLPFDLEGEYRISLIKDDEVIKEVIVNAIPKAPPEEPGKPTEEVTEDALAWLWLLVLLAILAVAFLYWRSTKSPKKR